MRHLLLIFTILLVSCSGAESILERDNTQSVSATPSIEPIASTNDDLKSLEERLTELESAIENNTLALENLSKSISSANLISDQNNSTISSYLGYEDEDYGKSPNNPILEGYPLKIDLREEFIKAFNKEKKSSSTIYWKGEGANIEFFGDGEEITIVSKEQLFFSDLGFISGDSKIKLPATFPINNNLKSLNENDMTIVLEITVAPPEGNSPIDPVYMMLIGESFEYEYTFKNP
tara:strand:- start:54 stop:755 length:702 start_codon:yes stop_codon:yes gene_type:complete